MTREQFLANLKYASDWYDMTENGLVIKAGAGVIAYLQRQQFNHFFPGQFFFQVFIETRQIRQGEKQVGTHTWTEWLEIKRYDVTQPSVSDYAQYAADNGSRYEAGENGVTIIRPGAGSVYIEYSEITAIYSLPTDRQDAPGQDNPHIAHYCRRETNEKTPV